MNADALEQINVFPTHERFTDADVRNHSSLTRMAKRYLAEYRGDFPYLREARKVVLSVESDLPVAWLRGVLNCMLGDYSVDWSEVTAEMRVASTVAPVLSLVPKPKPLRAQFPIKAKYKFHFVYSLQQGANRMHYVDHSESLAYYHREAHTINFVLKSECGKRWQSWRYYGDHKLKLATLPKVAIVDYVSGDYDMSKYLPEGYHWCPDCTRRAS